jgi:hypothetical protein
VGIGKIFESTKISDVRHKYHGQTIGVESMIPDVCEEATDR